MRRLGDQRETQGKCSMLDMEFQYESFHFNAATLPVSSMLISSTRVIHMSNAHSAKSCSTGLTCLKADTKIFFKKESSTKLDDATVYVLE